MTYICACQPKSIEGNYHRLFYIRLTWDACTYGSFLATVISQTLTSLSISAFTILVFFKVTRETQFQDARSNLLVSCQFSSLLVSVILLVVHAYLWIRGSRSFSSGVKDMRGPSALEHGTSMFGWKRHGSRHYWNIVPQWCSGIIFRRIEFVLVIFKVVCS